MSPSSSAIAPLHQHPETDSTHTLCPSAQQESVPDPDFDTFLSYTNYISSPDTDRASADQAHENNTTTDKPDELSPSQDLLSKAKAKFRSSITDHIASFYSNFSKTYTSPYASTQDSVSTSSKGVKRKLSSESTKSSSGSSYKAMAEDADMADWKPDELMMGEDGLNFGGYSATPNPSNPLLYDQDYEQSNTLMENDFDFDSAASSPSPYGPQGTGARRGLPSRDLGIPYRASPKPPPALQHSSSVPDRKFSKPFQTGLAATAGNSREASPTSGLTFSSEAPPSTAYHAQAAPNSKGITPDPMLGAGITSPWQSSSSFGINVQPSLSLTGFTPSPGNQLASPFSPSKSIPEQQLPFQLLLHPTPLKSRVETQIPIRMSLFPMPHGVTKLHLPTHSISKPKLMVKPEHVKSSDVLELSTMVVCTSAMSDPAKLDRAFARAAGAELTPPRTPVKTENRRRSSSDSAGSKETDSSDADDPEKPLNGGEIKICEGCMQRERKRASRKKVKKPEEEDAWLKDEKKRIVVFNTNELKEWGMPASNADVDITLDRPIPAIPEGALQVDAPMRIACYCRHQSEKVGFQVIFTIKDWQDKLIAQAITTSIMITDDHKTSIPANIQTGMGMNMTANTQPEMNSAGFAPSQGFGFHQNQAGPSSNGFSHFRMSHSHSDLQALQQHANFARPFSQGNLSFSANFQSQSTAATMTPRNLSRHASPTGQSGPSHKKRKSSTHARIPAQLAMTRLETNSPTGVYNMSSAGPSSANPSGAPSPFSSNYTTMPSDNNQLNSLQASMPLHTATGPPTPIAHDYGAFSQGNRSQSMENLSKLSLFSAPASAQPSRPSSPSNAQRGTASFQQAQAQAISNRLLHQLPQQQALRPHSTIHKAIPGEGPMTGGVEVTCLGSGFYQGLEVMFGDVRATTTTFWGESSLVCLLPPAAVAGVVPVTLAHLPSTQDQQQFGSTSPPASNATFNYIDIRETELMRMALNIVGHKWAPPGGAPPPSATTVAKHIVMNSPSGQWPRVDGNNLFQGNQSQHIALSPASGLESLDLEARLLKCLDLIDMDENYSQPLWEMRNNGGQTILHLACALGLHRFVAALLARGVNPEPRDKGGFSPMHFAALHNFPKLVHRLLINGADPTMRSLAGFQPANLAKSEEVLAMTRKVMKHSRARRRSSPHELDQLELKITLAHFLEQQAKQRSSPSYSDPGESLAKVSSASHGIKENNQRDRGYWIRSRRNSTTGEETVEVMPKPTSKSATSTIPAPIATFKKLAMQLQNLPHAPFKPSIPDYQKYLELTTRGFNSLVTWDMAPQDFFPTDLLGGNARYTWKELLSPPELPSYQDLYPNGNDGAVGLSESFDEKAQPALQSDVGAQRSRVHTERVDAAELSSSSSSSAFPETIDLRRGSKSGLTDAQREQIRAAHLRKIKRIKSDRTLFFFWIPSLVFIMLMITYNGLTRIWDIPRSVTPSLESLVSFRGV